MSNNNNNTGCGFLIILMGAILIFLLTLWSDRNLGYLATLIKGHPIDVPIWISFIFTIVSNLLVSGSVIFFNFVMEIIRFILSI